MTARRYTGAFVTLWRRNLTDTNRGRSTVVAEADGVLSVGFERYASDAASRVTLTVQDHETGTRFTLNIEPEIWADIVARVAAQS